MPQAPTTTQDPDEIIRSLGGNISAPDATPTDDADAIIRRLGGTISSSAPAAPPTVPGPPTAPAAKPPIDTSLLGLGKRVAAPMNPWTPEGRRNDMGMIGGGLAAYATGGATVAPWIASLFGAAGGGMLAEAGEQARSTFGDSTGKDAVPVSGTNVLLRGGEQALYDAVGHGLTKVAGYIPSRFYAAGKVAKDAQAWIEQNLETAKGAAEDLAADAMAKGRAYLRGVRATTRTDIAAAKTAAASENQIAAENARMGVDAATKVYELAAKAPEPAIKGARENVAKLTRTTAPRGASQVALDMAGRTVEASAATGPALPLAPVQQAIEQMLVEAHPGTIFQPQEKSTGIGFIDNLRARRQGEAAAAGAATSVDHLKLQERIAKAMGVSVDQLNAPGLGERVKELTHILGRVMTTKESQIPFADAHRLKLLLDESVNWDQTAKTAMERITKGARQVLREQLATHEPYNQATADYAKQVALYRRGAGKQLITDARERPDRVVRLLDPRNPAAAQQVKQLLVEQGIKGGDPAAAYDAWRSLQAAFIHDRIAKGGVEGLSQRIAKLGTDTPEGARVILDGDFAHHMLTNYDQIAQAFHTAQTLGEQFVERTAAKGKASVDAARTAASETRIGAQQAASDVRRAATKAGQAGVDAARATGREFLDSTLAPFTKTRKIEDDLTDAAVAATAAGSATGKRAILRLLAGPSSADLATWAAKSDRNTQRLVAVLTSQVTPQVTAALMREMIGAITNHDPTPTPAAQPGPPR